MTVREKISEQEKTIDGIKSIIEHTDLIHERNKTEMPNLGETCYYMPIYISFPEYYTSTKNNMKTNIAIIHDHSGLSLNNMKKYNRQIFDCIIMANTPREAYAKCLKRVVDSFLMYGKEEPSYLGALTNIQLITENEMMDLLKNEITQQEKTLTYLKETLQREEQEEQAERELKKIPCSELKDKSVKEINKLFDAGLIDFDR